ncbi:MAG: 16S rRNA (cytidine(1402)-2'-O)-methyltransferase [Vallitaleaceae bacterium]|jgi:16S rRNA (cytidine1402-2'-O)-methyltransferase|nr:16S rRNA (cytidine(1402)-2'-O)-methyltransferase [Vallitaleaceae bacterium]
MDHQLYLVATPIGNLGDMSLRAIEILRSVDVIACEDTRHSGKLLKHFEISKRLVSYHEHNKFEGADYLIELMNGGKTVALITDAGTPGISDPGEVLVRRCHEENIKVTSIPGPVAFVQALVLSGFETTRFVFDGFLPTQNKEKQTYLGDLEKEQRTIILYEAPHRLVSTLTTLFKALGNRRVAVVKEITKKFERVYKASMEEAITYYEENPPKGEYVLIIEGKSKEAQLEEQMKIFETISLEEHLTLYLKQGLTKKDAIKQIAQDRAMNKRDVYDYFKND